MPPRIILAGMVMALIASLAAQDEQSAVVPPADFPVESIGKGGNQAVQTVSGADTNAYPEQTPINEGGLFSPAEGMSGAADGFSPNPIQEGGMMSDEESSMEPTAAGSEQDGAGRDGVTAAEPKTPKWRIAPSLNLGYAYDSNLYLQNTNQLGTTVMTLGGGIAIQGGDFRNHQGNYLDAAYAGAGVFYGSAQSQDSYNQTATLAAQYCFERLRVKFESDFAKGNEPNRYAGGLIRSSSFFNALHFFHDYSPKTTLDAEFSQRTIAYQSQGGLNTSYNQFLVGGLYNLTPKVRIGLEGILGSNPTQESPTRYYQTVNGRLRYDLTGKVALKSTFGVQANEFASGGVPLKLTPVMAIGCEYKIFRETGTLGLDLYRNQQAAVNFNGQDMIATGIQANLEKGFGNHWSAGLGIGYENDTYLANQSTTTVSIPWMNYAFAKPRIVYHFLRHYDLSVFYQIARNDAAQQNYTWNDNRCGMEIHSSF